MKTPGAFSLLFILCLCCRATPSSAATLDDFLGVRWGASMEEAKKVVLADPHRVFERQDNGVISHLNFRGGRYMGRPVSWWHLCFVNNRFCHGFVDFPVYRDQPPLSQFRKLRGELVARYGEPVVDVDTHPHSDPSWEVCLAVKPFFKSDWKAPTSGPNPGSALVRLFMHGSRMEDVSMRLVYGNDLLSAERETVERQLKSGAVLPVAADDAQTRQTAVQEAFGKFHAAIREGHGKGALEMRGRASLGQMSEAQKAFWRGVRPNPSHVPNVQSVSMRTRTAGVYYTVKDSRGRLEYGFDLLVLEDDGWKIHLTRSEEHAPDDLARAFGLPPDTAPFIEAGEDWSNIEVMPTGDPEWSVQATSDSVFLYIRFIHATDLPLPGTSETAADSRASKRIYTPGISIGSAGVRDGTRLSVGECIVTHKAKPKNESLVDYSLTFRRQMNESVSVNVDNVVGILRILGCWVDIRIPREVLTQVSFKPPRFWVMPAAPATPREYTVKDPPRPPASGAKAASLPPIPAPDPLAGARQAMRGIAVRLLAGDPKALDDLRDTANALYRNVDYAKDKQRLLDNFKLMHAAYDLLGEEAGKGNARAFDALKQSLGISHLDGFAADALGIAAARGHAESLQMLLHPDQHKILKSSAVFALRASAEKKNAQAIEFLLAVLDNPDERALWYGAATGLAAAKDHPKVQAALEKYEKSRRTPAPPSR